MSRQAIVALEGNSFSGKTTTAESLAMTFGLPVIQEYDRYAGSGLNFPGFPPSDYTDAKKAIDFFVALEKRRAHEAIERSIGGNLPVIMDRSPFSCLVFQWTVAKRFPAIPNAYAYSIEEFDRAIQAGEIVPPDGLIYIEPESDLAFLNRVKARGRVHIDFLNDIETLRVMRYWYTEAVSRIFGESGILLKSIEDNMDLTTLFVFEQLTNMASRETTYFLQGLLEI